MNNKKETLSHFEIMEGLSFCFRELLQTSITDRKMPNIINRAKAAAGIVTASHREEIMEARRKSAFIALEKYEKNATKTLKSKNK